MKNPTIDYKAIALFEMAKQKYRECEVFAEELQKHLKDDDWVWQDIIEQEPFSVLMEHINRKQKKVKCETIPKTLP